MATDQGTRRRSAAALAVVAMAFGGVITQSTATAGEPASSSPPPVYGGHLTISGEAEVSNPWTPAAIRCDSYCYARARTFFDQLAVFGDDREVYGWLAESIEPNDDYTEWTIKVRPGISFTDGTPVDAAAVAYNLQATGTSLLVSQSVKDLARVPDPEDPSKQILKIEQLDDLTLVLYTGRDGDPDDPIPWPTFPVNLTQQFGLIASPAWLEAVAADPELATQPIGSGPFVVESYSPRENLEVVRNPDYWATDAEGSQLPYLDSITFRVIEDSEVAYEAVESGDVDLLSTSASGVLNDALSTDEVTVALQDQYVDTYYLMMDLDKAPFDDPRVRCALAMSIDRGEIVDAIGGTGVAVPANGLFSPGQEGYLEDNGLSIEPDPDTARELIEGYEAETGEEVAFTLRHTPVQSVVTAMELVQGYWNDIGADVELAQVPQNDLINMALFGPPEFQVLTWRSHAGLRIDQQFVWWHSANAAPDGELALNFGRMRDDDVDAGLETARSASDPAEAAAAAESVNRTFAEQCYQVPLAWLPWGVITVPSVGGVDTLQTPEGVPVLQSAGTYWAHTLSLAEQ